MLSQPAGKVHSQIEARDAVVATGAAIKVIEGTEVVVTVEVLEAIEVAIKVIEIGVTVEIEVIRDGGGFKRKFDRDDKRPPRHGSEEHKDKVKDDFGKRKDNKFESRDRGDFKPKKT